MIREIAPAKINLTLEVLGKRADGFHEIRSVMQAVGLGDTLQFRPGKNFTFKSDMAEWRPDESLVSKAASLLEQAAGKVAGASIKVEKRIPLMSGLGGDSSDAAATLRGLNRLWELNLSSEQLWKLAGQLGSDVSFFLSGGTALAEGRGELVTPLPDLPRMWVVIVIPPVSRQPGKTARLYASLKPEHYTDGRLTEKLVRAIKGETEFEATMLFNTFENVAFARGSELSVYRDHLLKIGAPHVHLSGSGPALFSLLNDETAAQELFVHCREQKLESYLVETLMPVDLSV